MSTSAPTTVLTTIRFECPSCQRHLRMVAELAGQLARCPVCRAMVKVPGEAATPMEVRGDEPTLPLRAYTPSDAG